MQMSNSSFQRLFNRRPSTATVGLSIAAISFLATILQGLMGLFSGSNRFFFDLELLLTTTGFYFSYSKLSDETDTLDIDNPEKLF
jgi:hypothetical protein